MRKLLMSSAVLFLFSASILMVQVACDEDVMAAPNGVSNETKILWNYSYDLEDGNLYIMDADGTNEQVIPLGLPSGWVSSLSNTAKPYQQIGDDGRIYFQARNTSSDAKRLYSIEQDGSGLLLIKEWEDGSFHFDITG